MSLYVYLYIYILFVCVYIYIYTLCMYLYIYTLFVCVYIYSLYVYIYMYTYEYICIYVYTQTYVHIWHICIHILVSLLHISWFWRNRLETRFLVEKMIPIYREFQIFFSDHIPGIFLLNLGEEIVNVLSFNSMSVLRHYCIASWQVSIPRVCWYLLFDDFEVRLRNICMIVMSHTSIPSVGLLKLGWVGQVRFVEEESGDVGCLGQMEVSCPKGYPVPPNHHVLTNRMVSYGWDD